LSQNAPNPIYFHGESNRSGETIVISRSGAYAGLVSFWSQQIFITDAFSIHPDVALLKATSHGFVDLKRRKELVVFGIIRRFGFYHRISWSKGYAQIFT
jgi:type I restriction enzyme, S subunit